MERTSKKRAGGVAGKSGLEKLPLRSVFAINVRDRRIGLKLTQVEAAGKAKVGINTFRRIEKAEAGASLDTVEAICKALEVKPSQMVP